MVDGCEAADKPVECSKCHVVFLHNKLRARKDDRYVVDLALGLKEQGYQVTILTTAIDLNNCFPEVLPHYGTINVRYSASYVPRTWYFVKAVIMAFRMCICPPRPKPKVVILDTNTIALFILSKLSNYKTILLAHFYALKELDFYSNYVKVTPDLLTAIGVTRADEIIVESECLGDIFRRSFPNFTKELSFIAPCVDTDEWNDELIEPQRIIPDLPSHAQMFVVFGQFKKRSNFKLVLDAMELVWLLADDCLKRKLHLVIGGNCNEKKPEELMYYDELIDLVKQKEYASQISILKQLPVPHRKSLLKKCTAMLIPTKCDPFPDNVLEAMRMGRTIIATNSGFAKYAITHRISGILVEANPSRFAAAMLKICTNPMVHTFICEMAGDVFRNSYAFPCVSKKISRVIEKQLGIRQYSLL